MDKTLNSFKRFLETLKTLRSPGGCPWDIEQTPLSMRSNLIEEVFEAADAISNEDAFHAKEELGDVFLNTMMIAYMYEQEKSFSIADTINDLTNKLILRHPHVFKQSEGKKFMSDEVKTSEEVLKQWEVIKEKAEGRSSSGSILDEVPKGFPPLLRAFKLQKKASKKGFDWQNIIPVKEKIFEELNEVQEALDEAEKAKENFSSEKIADTQIKPFLENNSPQIKNAYLHLEEEIGDLLFAVVNLSRHAGIDPENALNKANNKFYKRFSFVEQQMKSSGIPMDKEHLAEADRFWDKAKESGI